MKYLKSALLIALATASSGLAAQQYYPQTQNSNTGEAIIQQILEQVIGRRYTTDNRYRSREEQEMFRRADLNRDGYLTQAEIDNYRRRMGYSRYGNDRYYDPRQTNTYYQPGIPVSRIDTNRDGYISQAEASYFVRLIQSGAYNHYQYRNR